MSDRGSKEGAVDLAAHRRRRDQGALADEWRGQEPWRTLGDTDRRLCLWARYSGMGSRLSERSAKVIDRLLLTWGWCMMIALAAVFVFPTTGLVYQPSTVTISGDQVTVDRSFPMDGLLDDWRPRISYIETIKPLTQAHNGGQDCVAEGSPRVYDSEDILGVWSIPWAADCLTDPRGFDWETYWYWHVGGMKVGPVSLSTRVLRDPCQYRISTTGHVHGPDSPHWSQTSTERCFPTREAAEAALE